MRTRAFRLRCAMLAAALLMAVTASPALAAFQEEDGNKNCGDYIAYLHARYNDAASLLPPGGTFHSYTPYDGLWHVQEVNGDYSGYWYAVGTPYLDLPNTWAACRNYG